MGMGGGALVAGWPGSLALAVARGYAGAHTDAGHSIMAQSPWQGDAWALHSPGNVNWQELQNFASIALDDMTGIAKAIVYSFYGKAPKYSYWNGCSTGGRQGLMLAQRYPENYDGILAAAPAIGWSDLELHLLWSHVNMREAEYRPPPCELMAIIDASLEACDELDGVKDGVISAPGLCHFDADSAIGRTCCDGRRKVSKEAAYLANQRFSGPRSDDGSRLVSAWSHGTPLAQPQTFGDFAVHLAQTHCDEDHNNCERAPFSPGIQWAVYWLAADPNYDLFASMDRDELIAFWRRSKKWYGSILDTTDTDLSEFKKSGAKLLVWHGLADQVLPVNGSSDYYKAILQHDRSVPDYFRYFEAPGVEHCMGGVGPFPTNALSALEKWVESGQAPDHLNGVGATSSRKICAYPKVARYQGGDARSESSFECAEDFGQKHAVIDNVSHDEL